MNPSQKSCSSRFLRCGFAALLTFIAVAQAPGQQINFYPAVDSLCLWGTCTPPDFYWHTVKDPSDSDRVVIRPHWSMLVQGTPPFHIVTTFDSAYFTIHDTTGLNRYELVLTSYCPYDSGRFNIHEDSLTCVLEGRLSFTLLVFRGSALIDSSLVNGFSFQTGLAVGNQNRNVAQEVKLYQNYPNPFNPTTTISYYIPRAMHLNIRVFSTLGQEVAVLVDETRPAGPGKVLFNSTGLPSGLYFCQLHAGIAYQTRKMILLK